MQERFRRSLLIQFPASEMKPLHAQWTADSFLLMAEQQHWMENAFRGTGIWPIFEGTFEPDPTLEALFFQPPVATTAEAATDVPDTESESEAEFCSGDSDTESEQGETSEHEHQDFQTSTEQQPADHSDMEENIQPKQPMKRRRTVFEDSDEEETLVKTVAQTPLKGSVPQTPRSTRTSRNARALEEERDQLEQAIARSLVELRGSAPEPSSEDTMVLERDDEGILEEETEFFRQRFLQQGQWRVNYLNEPWQLAKRLLIQQDLWPNKFRAHPQQHSFIKSPNVAPKKLFKLQVMDLVCLGAYLMQYSKMKIAIEKSEG